MSIFLQNRHKFKDKQLWFEASLVNRLYLWHWYWGLDIIIHQMKAYNFWNLINLS